MAHAEIVDAVCRGDEGLGLTRIAISPSVPVVAVGAPVRIYYPEVGRRLKGEVVFPEHCEVANAVGAATGIVARRVSVQVAGDGGGVFRVYTPEGTLVFDAPQPALETAQAVATADARVAAIAMGAGEPEIWSASRSTCCPMPWTKTACSRDGDGGSDGRPASLA